MKFIPPELNVFLLDFKALSLASPEPDTLGAMKYDSRPPPSFAPEAIICLPSARYSNFGLVRLLAIVLLPTLFLPAPSLRPQLHFGGDSRVSDDI